MGTIIMYIYTPQQVRDLDQFAITQCGIPGVVLMENAGRNATESLCQQLTQTTQTGKTKYIAIFAGPGNNGGDGYVMARHLLNRGYTVWTFLCASSEAIQGDALINLRILKQMTDAIYPCHCSDDLLSWRERLSQCDAFVDALLGTGMSKDLSGWYLDLIAQLNQYQVPFKMAVDIPSGLDASTGQPRPICFKADLTVSFAAAKIGLCLPSALPFVGHLEIADIGIPLHITPDPTPYAELLEESEMRKIWPHRSLDSHKGNYGHLLVIAGSLGKSGAALLSSLAALRSGAGLCTLASDRAVIDQLEGHIPDLMCERLDDLDCQSQTHITDTTNKPDVDNKSDGHFSVDIADLRGLEALIQGKSAILIGPGLGQNHRRRQLLFALLHECKLPLVIDADGLNLLATDPDILNQRTAPTILTPHPAEMARLCRTSTAYIQSNRPVIASQFAQQYGVTLVLKGLRTVIASPQGSIWLNPTGNPGLATAGTGDVLAGMLAALIAQQIPPNQAACLATYLHGKTADHLLASHSMSSMLASDLIAAIPSVTAQWE
jgi:NAD(P)H-hydrate epimerase